MDNKFRITINPLNEKILLSIVDRNVTTKKNCYQKLIAEEAANGYIIADNDLKSIALFDLTTIVGDMLNIENSFFDFIKENTEKQERFVYVQRCLAEYFEEADFSIMCVEKHMGIHKASFGTIGANGITEYTCDNLQQVVFSILHFLILSGYKFTNCKHCGKMFATKNLKVVFCKRFSTFEGYEGKPCGDAVKDIRDKLDKRRKCVYERLRGRANEYGYHSKHGDILRDFQSKCAIHKEKIKEIPSKGNLQEYHDYLYNDDKFPHKYERIRSW